MEEIFTTTESQRTILETVVRFVEDEIMPRAAMLDAKQNPEECWSWEIIEAADRAGIRTMTLDERLDGLGIDSMTTSMVLEELAKGDIGISIAIGQNLKMIQVMQKALTLEQQERVLPGFAADPRGMMAIGITEPDNGSNFFIPYPTPFRTNARKVADGWVINGMKHFINNGNRASWYFIIAQTESGKPVAEASTCFLIERCHPGFTIGHVHNKMGERLANNAELIFQDCIVPNNAVVGTVNGGFDILSQFFPMSNAYAGSAHLGCAVALYEKAVQWAKVRVQGGKPLIEHGSIRAQLSEMRMLIDAARAYMHRACWLADHRDKGWDRTLAVFPKAMASQVCWKLAQWCLEIHGGHGYMKESGVEKLVRDAASALHGDGVNRTLFLKAANFIYAK
jgi:alkylation response protein AidB-like acyl-CoA dehydrogenase